MNNRLSLPIAFSMVLTIAGWSGAQQTDSAAQQYVESAKKAYDYAAYSFLGDIFPALGNTCLLSDWLRDAYLSRSKDACDRVMINLAHLARMQRIHDHAVKESTSPRKSPMYRIEADYYFAQARAKVFHSLGGKYMDPARRAAVDCIAIAQRGFDAELARIGDEFTTYRSILRNALFWSGALQDNEVKLADTELKRQKAVERSLNRIATLIDLAKTDEDRKLRAFEEALFRKLKADLLLAKLGQKHTAEASQALIRAAEKLYNVHWNELKEERSGSFSAIYRWSNEWRLALLDEEKDKAKRVAANLAHLRRMEELLVLAADIYRGSVPEEDLLNVYLAQARYFVAKSKAE